MSESAAGLRHKIGGAEELHSIVRTMKAVAASNIGQYEKAMLALDDYYRSVQLGLVTCFNRFKSSSSGPGTQKSESGATCLIVFGSDQGLVGQFNEIVVEHVIQSLGKSPGETAIWTVGERVHTLFDQSDLRIADIAGIASIGESFKLPNSIHAITALLDEILIKIESYRENGAIGQVDIFYNHPMSGENFAPLRQSLLPLDEAWKNSLIAMNWPTNNLAEVVHDDEKTLLAFVSEYLFVSIFRACVQSQASENMSRLAAMQRAEKNIDEQLEVLNKAFHRVRQSSIDEELFELISGFEAIAEPVHSGTSKRRK